EYMAMEKLYELHSSGRFDVIVVDTPPTRRALDFLDAPRRFNRFLDNKVFRMLMARSGLRAVSAATNMFLKTVARVVGADVVADALEFFRDFEGMEAGFRARSEGVLALLGDDATAFVVVFSPRRDAVEEAQYFIARLAEWSMWVEAVVVNRVFPRFDAPPPEMPGGAGGGADLVANRRALGTIAEAEEALVASVTEEMADATVSRVPLLVEDVHDIDGLDAVGAYMFHPGS
ncbi:MAG: ArsA family ATPase, partial [Acidimicrobiales bacterium]